jgi:hypothetical protein
MDQRKRGAPRVRVTDRTPPHDIELERDVLGGILSTPEPSALVGLARVGPDVFWLPQHGVIARGPIALHAGGAVPTPGTVAEVVARESGQPVERTSTDLRELAAAHTYVPAAGVGPWLATLERYHRARRMVALAGELDAAAHNGHDWHDAAARIADLIRIDARETTLDESWERVDLGPALSGELPELEPTVLRRDDGVALFTAGRINGIHGDSGIGKSWVALVAAAQELDAGKHVIWVDFEDPDPSTVVNRLTEELDAPDEAITERLHYYRPLEPFDDAAVTELEDVARSTSASLLRIYTASGASHDAAQGRAHPHRLVRRPVARAFRARFPENAGEGTASGLTHNGGNLSP